MSANVRAMREAHKVLATFEYEPAGIERGYTGRWLHVDVGKGQFRAEETTDSMKELFVGGKGFDVWIMWNQIKKRIAWTDPENCICMSGGPLCGTSTFPGAGKTLVTSISPMTGIVIDSNVGGYAGPFLKIAGWDALCIQGKCETDSILFFDVRHKRITLEEAPLEAVDSFQAASEFHQMYAEDEKDLSHISVISAGRGAEHTLMGCLNFSFWDHRSNEPRLKQAGRGGIGTVFRDKKLKAIVLRVGEYRPRWTITVD